MKKYELTDETKVLNGVTLHHIRAVRDIEPHGVKAGELGGWVETEHNLSQNGNAWVSGNAQVSGNAVVYGNAQVGGYAWVYDNAVVGGNAVVYGNAVVGGYAWVYDNAQVGGYAVVYGNAVVGGYAVVSDDADYMVFKNSWTSGRYFTYTRSNGMWRAGCFHGTGEELVKKAYADSVLSGRCYEAIVRAVESIEAARAEAKGEKE